MGKPSERTHHSVLVWVGLPSATIRDSGPKLGLGLKLLQEGSTSGEAGSHGLALLQVGSSFSSNPGPPFRELQDSWEAGSRTRAASGVGLAK